MSQDIDGATDPNQVPIIEAAPTAVVAFVGSAATGPVGVPQRLTGWPDFAHEFGGFAWFSYLAWAVYEFFAEGGESCYVLRLDDGAAAAATVDLGTTRLRAASVGSWANALRVNIVDDAATATSLRPSFSLQLLVPAAPIDAALDSKTLPADLSGQLLVGFVVRNRLATTTVAGIAYYVLESYEGLSAGDVGSGALAARIDTASIFLRVERAGNERPAATATPLPLQGGISSQHDYRNDFAALDLAPDFDLLALPDAAAAVDAQGRSDSAAHVAIFAAALRGAEQSTRWFCVIDAPYGADVDAALHFVAGASDAPALTSSYGALYVPWLWAQNPMIAATVPMPACGPVLGRYAATDATVGVFAAPAGVPNGQLQRIDVDRRFSDADQERLNAQNIDAVRSFPNLGPVVWGARTLSGTMDWRYVSVRRLAMHIERSVVEGLRWTAFEPGTPSLCARVALACSRFLFDVWHAGGLLGSSASEAFQVTCDASNNPPAALASGQLQVLLTIAPVSPAEFLQLPIVLACLAVGD